MRRSRHSSRSGGLASSMVTESEQETQRLGERLARSLAVPSVVLLRGSLGTGKTTLARGIARGLGVRDAAIVNSPSFTLVNIYKGRCPIYHVDLYRLSGERDLYSIGIDEILDADGVVIVEWSERLEYPAESAIQIEIHDLGGDRRKIDIIEGPPAGRP